LASQKSKRRSRKRHKPGAAPRAVPSQRREQRAERQIRSDRERSRATGTLGTLGTLGERPPSPFGGVPVAEIAIFAGGVALVVGFIRGGGTTVVVGLIVCALGVLEVTAREHFSGYRSHTTLLAGIPAVGAAVGVVSLVGPAQSQRATLVLLIGVPVFGVLFWWLRQRFVSARQARIARPPAP
jgi:hypothetical protein